MTIQIILPWPPSINHYYGRQGNRSFILPKGIKYRNEVSIICRPFRNYFKLETKINLSIKAYPPDKRKRDLDNIFKCCLDSLQISQVFVNDFQIDRLSIERVPIYDGFLIVDLERI